MKKTTCITLNIVVAFAFLVSVKAGDATPAGKQALRKSLFADAPRDHDFTKIPPGALYKPGELMVHFMPKAGGKQRTTAEKQAVLAALSGATIEFCYDDLVPGLIHVRLPKNVTVEQALKTFNNRPEILYAEPNYRLQLVKEPNDTRWDELWGMEKTDAPGAWDVNTVSNIVVAVIDSGVDYNHEDLADNMWINPGEDFPPLGVVGPEDYNGVNDDGNLYVDDIYGADFYQDTTHPRDADPMDECGHGTHCAGTIAAVGNNDTGVAGVCWDGRIMALKYTDRDGYGWSSDACLAITYAKQKGAKVANLSFGTYQYPGNVKNALRNAIEAGMLFTAAAGNNNVDNDTNEVPFYPASFDLDGIISVLATTSFDTKSSSSNYGATTVDLGAPGEDILSCRTNNRYQYASGTSMASPHVAGACALVWSQFPTLTNLEIKDLILENVDEVSGLQGLCVTNGRLNVSKAMRAYLIENVTQGKFYSTLDYTIQDVIDDAVDGDTIIVPPLTFDEQIDFSGKAVTVTSQDPEDPEVVAATIIDGDGNTVTFDSSEGNDAVLKGITITGGCRGIYCDNASPTISGCVIRDINSSEAGAGMYCRYGSPAVQSCCFTDNSSSSVGGAIYLDHSSAVVANCTFSENSAAYFGGAIEAAYGCPVLLNCLFTANTVTDTVWGAGGAVDLAGITSATVSNCTFSGNHSNWRGGAICNYTSSPQVKNCIFWGDTADDCGGEIYDELYGPRAPVFSYCDIEGGLNGSKCCGDDSTDGGGNINSDPQFVSPGTNFHIGSASPCINAGDPNGDYTGQRDMDDHPRVMAATVDIGADEYAGIFNLQKRTWYSTIQAAINDANDGNTIEVGPGTYNEKINFNGKVITVTGVEPENADIVAATIIDGGSRPSVVVTFNSSEGPNSQLKGLTVPDGQLGILCSGASPTITNCILTSQKMASVHVSTGSAPKLIGCEVSESRYGIMLFDSEATIRGCLIQNNRQDFGIWSSGPATIEGNRIRQNRQGISLTGSSAKVRNNWICDNSSEGLAIIDSNAAEIRNNTIVGNQTGIQNDGNQPVVLNCILWGNTDDMNECTASYSCVSQPEDACGIGSITDDPLFVDETDEDFHLRDNSPCVEKGDPNTTLEPNETDIDGQARLYGDRVDMGADEVPVKVYNVNKQLWYRTIQLAVDGADPCDTIEVTAGTYNESIDFKGKAITVRSTEPNDWSIVEQTVINGGGSDVVTFANGEGPNSVLRGFKITGGGRGILCDATSPTISDCNITGNARGMLNDNGASPDVTHCIFYQNNAAGWGGGMCNDHSAPTVTGCVFTCNDASDGGGMVIYDCAPRVANCVFYNNTAGDGGAIYTENPDAEPNIVNCTFFHNHANGKGGAFYNYDDSGPRISNCVLWGNTADSCGGEIYNDDAEPNFSHCDIDGGLNGTKCGGDPSVDGQNNIDEDPDFESETNVVGGDGIWATWDDGLALGSSSPCIDAGDNAAISEPNDITGNTRKIDGDEDQSVDVDMGPYEYDPS